MWLFYVRIWRDDASIAATKPTFDEPSRESGTSTEYGARLTEYPVPLGGASSLWAALHCICSTLILTHSGEVGSKTTVVSQTEKSVRLSVTTSSSKQKGRRTSVPRSVASCLYFGRGEAAHAAVYARSRTSLTPLPLACPLTMAFISQHALKSVCLLGQTPALGTLGI